MLKGISNSYPNDLPFYEQRSSLHERKRLLSMLLSRRNALRVICAPSLYGKSVLAYQYAQQVFQDESVNWIDASEPSFLLALDRGLESLSARLLASQDVLSKPDLFVIDGCPFLDDGRFDMLHDLIAKLLKMDHEVILTTDDTRWLVTGEFPCQAIDAQLLLLDEREEVLWSDLDARAAQEASTQAATQLSQGAHQEKERTGRSLLDAIAGCRGHEHAAHDRFVTMLENSAVRTEEEALAMVMLLLGSGALHEMRAYTADLSDALLMNIERRYPHAGITTLSPMFVAVPLTEQDKFRLVRRHADEIFRSLKAFKAEDDLIASLVKNLMKREQIELATQLVCGSHDEAYRGNYLDEQGRSFLFAGRPLSLLHLANTLPRSSFESTERWLGVAVALAMLNESELATRVMRSFQTKDRSAADELSVVLTQVVLGIAERTERTALVEAVERYAQEASESAVKDRFLGEGLDLAPAWSSRKDSSFMADIFTIIERTVEDPRSGYAAYQRFAAAGHSIKECLCALDLFVALLAFLTPHETARSSSHEQEMLAKLEQDIVYVLARQAALLPPNMLECHLFDQARILFDEQIYLHVDDQVLNRIESFRAGLARQQDKWRAHRLTAPLVLSEAAAARSSHLQPSKKALRINTLGRFEIEPHDDQIVVKDKVRKQLRLLISLMAINNGRELARPWVQRVMWPDAPERNAKQNLYTMWSLLNRSVTTREGACPFFESYPQSLSLNAQLVETDTQLLDDICKRLRYETLEIPLYEKAIEDIEDLYRGPLLPGDDTAEVVAHRKKYQERLIEALLKGGEHLRKCGETTLALRYFRFAFDNEPTREDVCYQLMLVLWKLGRHGEALNEYFVCRRALIDTFGIEGNAKLRELYETILNDAS